MIVADIKEALARRHVKPRYKQWVDGLSHEEPSNMTCEEKLPPRPHTPSHDDVSKMLPIFHDPRSL